VLLGFSELNTIEFQKDSTEGLLSLLFSDNKIQGAVIMLEDNTEATSDFISDDYALKISNAIFENN